MKTITKFKAIDGKEFTDKEECLNYELLIEKVDTIMALLPPKPNDNGCSFSNGDGYLQHNKATLRNAQLQILELCKKYIDHKWIQETIDDENVHLSYVGRLIDDYNINPINSAWFRFMCIDKYSREWGQPYYANNPEKGKQVSVG